MGSTGAFGEVPVPCQRVLQRHRPPAGPCGRALPRVPCRLSRLSPPHAPGRTPCRVSACHAGDGPGCFSRGRQGSRPQAAVRAAVWASGQQVCGSARPYGARALRAWAVPAPQPTFLAWRRGAAELRGRGRTRVTVGSLLRRGVEQRCAARMGVASRGARKAPHPAERLQRGDFLVLAFLKRLPRLGPSVLDGSPRTGRCFGLAPRAATSGGGHGARGRSAGSVRGAFVVSSLPEK